MRVLESSNKQETQVHTQHIKKSTEEHEKSSAAAVHASKSNPTGGTSTLETKDNRAAYSERSSQSTATSGDLSINQYFLFSQSLHRCLQLQMFAPVFGDF
jgi:hypothetical protein